MYLLVYSKSPKPPKPKGKEKRVWANNGTNDKELDYSGSNSSTNNPEQDLEITAEQVGFKRFRF